MTQNAAMYQVGPAAYYSIDVECVATGTDHNSRAVGQIALVDQYEQVILDIVVKPVKPVVSYLTALTGLTQDIIDTKGVSLPDAVQQLRSCLPKDAVLVGQNILQDVQWLGLREGTDFKSCLDLAGLYRVWNSRYNSYSVFSQDHLVKALLGWNLEHMQHNAAFDALKSIKLFNLYQQYQADQQAWQQAQQAMLNAPPTLSFARNNPSYEGVCMGNRKTCTCGAAFFS
ncbi:ribonuclease H-like domain-containing protein [Scenedesmus sp. NREL 46B-D3]|nr:ribonuclease H-like domain-containing protein [Scenedesmus sp. NREL 46B-D3]